MNRNRTAAVTGLALLFLLACSAPMFATPTPIPTSTPMPTATPIPTATATITPTATPMPVVIASGMLDIPQTYLADLDSGVVPLDPKNPVYGDVDLWFDAVSNTQRYLEPYNGAMLMAMGMTQVGYEDCKVIEAPAAVLDINTIPSGTYICVSTNAKNTSVVRVNSIDSSWPGRIRLDFMTWHQP